MQLMSKAGGVFADVANQLDPKKEKYEPRKAMEYVAALGFLLRHVGSVRDWIGTDLCVREGRGQAFRNIRSSVHDTFMSIWPAANGPATDFVGKVKTEGKATAVIGQIKIAAEVMSLAWVIGKAVKEESFGIPVLAVFVSSCRAPSSDWMLKLRQAFRVAMSGTVSKVKPNDWPRTNSGKKRLRLMMSLKYYPLSMSVLTSTLNTSVEVRAKVIEVE